MQRSSACQRHRASSSRRLVSSRPLRLNKLAVRSVLAPPRQQTRSKLEAPAEESSIWRSASQLVSGFRIWPSTQDAAPQVPAVQQQQQQSLASAPAVSQSLLDCNAYLATCGDDELRAMRMLAHLCGQTYYIGALTPRKLQLWHNLELITTSLCCERLVHEHNRTEDEVQLEADGMAGPALVEAMDLYASSSTSEADVGSGGAEATGGAAAISATAANNVVPFSTARLVLQPVGTNSNGSSSPKAVRAAASAFSAAAVAQQASATAAGAASNISADTSNTSLAVSSKRSSRSPAELVATKLSEAAAAASAAALQPLASAAQQAAGTLYAGSMNLVSSVTSTVTSTVITSQMPGLGPAAGKVLRDTIAGITTAEIATSHPNSKDVKAASTSSGTKCPSDWFVADSETYNTRYFVIQGSDSIDHWKTNLMFEPVPFEGTELGIKVHRGAYEAAQALYERFLPLVQEHVDKDPTAKVCFTGHSIGGAMAVLLMLMFRSRGVLLPQQIAPVYAFGAPALFCDGALGGWNACSDDSDASEACSLGGSLLSRLGLRDDAIRSVMMARDIVPRVFCCDYSLVAEILRGWGPSWRDHTCLTGGVTGEGRRQLFVHIGRTFVLQPSTALKFVTEPNPHLPLLPQQAEVYELMPRPTLASAMAAARYRAAQGLRSLNELNVATQIGLNPALSLISLGRPARDVEEVLAAIMDAPHPLDSLSEPAAYGPAGSISRYHNPDNYCMALGRTLAERKMSAAMRLSENSGFVVPKKAAQHRPFFPPPSPSASMDGVGAEAAMVAQ